MVFSSDKDFEDEVRRIARLIWPSAEYGGAEIVSGRERDGIFETDEFIHIIECTTSRSKSKAQEDLSKLSKLCSTLGAKHPQKFIKGWFITLNEPTPDQRTVFRKSQGRFVAVSYEQFRSKLVDAKSYLLARFNYPFGSVRDPETGAAAYMVDYVQLDILDEKGGLHSANDIAHHLQHMGRYALIGDYGAGKSATIREIAKLLGADFDAGRDLTFPIAINLRDHPGQTDPVEVLERHARNVGYSRPSDLVRAWRAGYASLLLDGFDEIATAGWAGRTKKLKDLRYRSMEAIRAFLRDTPANCGVLLSGRAHFFDSTKEMKESLNIGADFTLLNISEFNEAQVRIFLSRAGWEQPVPSWVPARPLLLGYLASRKLLQQTLEVGTTVGPANGWNELMDRICKREAEIEAGIDPGTVRRLLGFLATKARTSVDGLGPVFPEQITDAFIKVCGYPPDDKGMVLLQRLPGLAGHSSQDGSRVFIDGDFAEVARGGTIAEFIENPYLLEMEPESWQNSLKDLGADVSSIRCNVAGMKSGKMRAALHHSQEMPRSGTLTADIFLTMLKSGGDYDGDIIFVKDVLIPELFFEDLRSNLSKLHFQDCIIGTLELPPDILTELLPSFTRCHFGVVESRTGTGDMPDVFIECTYDTFENPAQTTNAILALGLPVGTKILLTALKKLYAQRGSGRRESAFYRGLDARGKELVPGILALLRKRGFAAKSKHGDQDIWLPTKPSEFRRRALTILAAPNVSTDPLVVESREITS
jgi:hypothetical protein